MKKIAIGIVILSCFAGAFAGTNHKKHTHANKHMNCYKCTMACKKCAAMHKDHKSCSNMHKDCKMCQMACAHCSKMNSKTGK